MVAVSQPSGILICSLIDDLRKAVDLAAKGHERARNAGIKISGATLRKTHISSAIYFYQSLHCI